MKEGKFTVRCSWLNERSRKTMLNGVSAEVKDNRDEGVLELKENQKKETLSQELIRQSRAGLGPMRNTDPAWGRLWV